MALGMVDPKKNPLDIGKGNTLVRKGLVGQGFTDQDIGWDAGRKTVTLKGADFGSPSSIVGGSTVMSDADFNDALSRYRNNETSAKVRSTLGQLDTEMNTPYKAPEFNYAPESDPVYQSALRRAQANAGTASGNAMAEMNRRGILNSTVTGDRVAQIQQSEMGRVSDTVLPQLMQQAYGRYRDNVGDQQTEHRNRIADLANVLGITTGLQDRERNNDQQQWQDRFQWKQFDQGVKDSGRNFDRGVLESDRGFDRGVLESDRGFKRGALESDRSFNLSSSNSGADNSRADSSASFNKLKEIWAATGKAPSGLESYGVMPGDPYKPESDSPGGSKELQGEIEGLYNGLTSGQISTSQASSEIEGRLRMGLITPDDAAKMKSFIQKYAEGGGSGNKPQVVSDKLLSMSPEQLLNAWKTDPTGEKAGRAKYDWRSWVLDPNGYKAGLTYEMWQDQYGPRLGG